MSSIFAEILERAIGEIPVDAEYQFDLRDHEWRLAMNHGYAAWWESLAPDVRDGYELQFQERVAEQLREKEAADARAAELEKRIRLEGAGVPFKDIERIASGQVQETSALAECRAFVDDGDCILVLSGERGCGKTTAASWLFSQSMPGPKTYGRGRRTSPSLFVDVSRLARLSRYRDEDMEPLEEALLLVIDDLGMEYADEKGSFLSTLDGLFNTRYAAQLYTVITTNLPAKAFRARYGERIADRIREAGRFVELADKSLRGGK